MLWRQVQQGNFQRLQIWSCCNCCCLALFFFSWFLSPWWLFHHHQAFMKYLCSSTTVRSSCVMRSSFAYMDFFSLLMVSSLDSPPSRVIRFRLPFWEKSCKDRIVPWLYIDSRLTDGSPYSAASSVGSCPSPTASAPAHVSRRGLACQVTFHAEDVADDWPSQLPPSARHTP